MIENSEEGQKVAVIAKLEEILSKLDERQLSLPALKIVEALEALEAPSRELPDDHGGSN